MGGPASAPRTAQTGKEKVLNMSQTNAGVEILEMALEMEKNGRSLYEHLARAGNGRGKMYQELAAREQEHESVLNAALGRLAGQERPGVYPWDYYQYMI